MNCPSCPAYSSLDQQCRWNACEGHVAMTNKGPVIIGGWPGVGPTGWCMNHPRRQELLRRHKMELVNLSDEVALSTQPTPDQPS